MERAYCELKSNKVKNHNYIKTLKRKASVVVKLKKKKMTQCFFFFFVKIRAEGLTHMHDLKQLSHTSNGYIMGYIK